MPPAQPFWLNVTGKLCYLGPRYGTRDHSVVEDTETLREGHSTEHSRRAAVPVLSPTGLSELLVGAGLHSGIILSTQVIGRNNGAAAG